MTNTSMQLKCSYCKRLAFDTKQTECEGYGAPLDKDPVLESFNVYERGSSAYTIPYTPVSLRTEILK